MDERTNISVTEFARLTGSAPVTARLWVRQGLVKAEKAGAYWVVDYRDALRFERERRKGRKETRGRKRRTKD